MENVWFHFGFLHGMFLSNQNCCYNLKTSTVPKKNTLILMSKSHISVSVTQTFDNLQALEILLSLYRTVAVLGSVTGIIHSTWFGAWTKSRCKHVAKIVPCLTDHNKNASLTMIWIAWVMCCVALTRETIFRDVSKGENMVSLAGAPRAPWFAAKQKRQKWPYSR